MNAQTMSPCRLICRYAALVTVLLLVPAIALAQAPPGAPDAVTLTRDDGTVTADWPAVAGATRYHVTYSTDGGASWHAPVDDHQNVTANRLTFSADNSKTYVVGVRARNDHGWSGWVNSDPAGPFVPPVLSAARNDGGDSATVSWTPYGGGDFAYYRVIVCDDTQYDGASCDGTVYKSDAIDDANDTGPLTVTGLDAGTGYGVILQVWRSGAALKLHAALPALVTLPLVPPAAPTGLSAAAGGDDSVTLTWDDPADSGITGYEYQVNHNDTATGKLSGWGAWQPIAGSGAATTAHTITGLTSGREYRFRLRALNADIVSKAAPTAYPWYVTALQGQPSAPTGITVNVDLNVMTVGWNAVAGADGYDVRTRMDGAEWVVVAADVAGTAVNVTILQMPDHTGVRARAGDAVSAWTDVSRLPPPDVFDPPSGGAGAQAQAQGGQAQNTLPKPANVRVKRWNGGPRALLGSKDFLTITWDAVPGATGYRIACDWSAGDRYGYGSFRKCGKDGSAWKVYGTSAGTDGVTVRYLDGPKDDGSTGNWVEMIYGEGSLYSVIVQAVKDGTPGAWSAIVEAHPAYMISWGPKIGKYQGLDASSRTASGFTLAWVHVYRGAGYVAECVEKVNGKPSGNWTTCGEDDNVFSEKMVNGQAVNTAQAHLYGDTATDRIVTVSIADLDLDTTGQQSFDPWKSYDVRASTLNPSGQSLFDYPPLSITEPYYTLAASNVTSSGATLSVTNYAQGWWYERTRPSGDSTCHAVLASPYTASLSSLTPGTSYTYKVYDQSGCDAVNEKDSVTFTTPKPAASEVTATTATLSLPDWSAAWWYKGNQSGATCTSVAAGTTTVALGSLTAGTPYTYTTYSKDGCGSADAIGSATFTTPPLAKGRHAGKDVDTLNAAGNTSPWGLWSNGTTTWVADTTGAKLYAYKTSDDSRDATKDFNTLNAAGNANPAGIWSDGTTLWVADDSDKKLYAYKMSDRSRDAAKDFNTLDTADNDHPAGIWSDGVTMWVADTTDKKLYAYKMSDRSRDTGKDFNTLNGAGNTNPAGIWSDGVTLWVADTTDDKLYAYKMSDRGRDAGKDFDTLSAAGNTNPAGIWSDGAAMWVADPDDDKLYAYQMMPRLSVSAVTDTAATLTLANRAGDWYYKADSGPDSICQGPVSGASEALSGLTAGTPYDYTAYSASGCNSADKVDTVTFSAVSLTAGSLATTTATLTLSGHTGDWWLKQTLPAGGTCTAGEADFSHALSGLTSVTAYDYAAYRDSNCTTRIATVEFTTHGLAAGSFSLTGATLTLTGHTGNWWLKKTAPSAGTCTAGEADFSHALSTLTGGTLYTYAAYGTSSCATPIDTVTFATHGLRAVSVTPTGAMLWLTGHTGDWWLKQTSPSAGTCTAGEADLSHALGNLTTGTSYTWTAYSDSTCATVIDTATFTPGYVAGQRYAGKDFDTLYAAGNNGPRGLWSDGTTMWVSDRDDKKIYAYKRSDTSRDSAKDFNTLDAAGNQNPAGIWSDGTTMWVADRDDAKLYAYKMSDKSRDAAKDFTTLAAAGNNDPYGLWSDGTTMYVVDFTDGKIYAYKMSDKSRDAGKDFTTLAAAGNGGPLGLWSDGVTMWVGDWDDDKLYAYRMNDRSRDAGQDFDTLHAAGNHYGSGMWSDGATMWVADLGSDKLWAYQMPARLSASGVAASTATLTLAGYTGSWWLKQTAPTAGTCTAGESDFSHALSTLTAGVTYTWTAYSASSCASAAALDAASFTTTVSVSSLANARVGGSLIGRYQGTPRKAAAQFTTGGSAGGYVLSAVTIDIDGLYGTPGDLTVAIYSDSGNRPSASLITLSGSNPSGEGQATYTCAGSCALAAGTKYHVLLEAPNATGPQNHYSWEMSDSANEVTQPSNNGWSIGGSYRHASNTWSDITYYLKFRVRAVPNPALGPTSLTLTSATLTLAHYVGAWWYKRTSPSGDDTCHRVANGAAASLATLTENTAYTYTAYSASGCNSADEIMAATFTTPGPGDRRASLDFDTLSAAGNTAPGGVWSNGTTMWVTDWNDDKLYAYKMSDKSRDAAKDFNTLQAAGNTDPLGIWSDGTTMWVANLGDDKIYAYRMSDKARDAAKDFNTLQAAGNENVRGIWSDGTTTWAADYSDDKLYAYETSGKARDAGKDFNTLIAADNREPHGLWSDGTTMWVVDDDNDKIYAYKTSDKARDATRDYGTLSAAGNTQPAGIWSDGTTTWVADQIDGKLYAYYARPPTKRLLASNLTDGGARLDVTWHTEAWWYARTAPSGDTTCHSVVAGTTHATLSGLDDGTAYTYKAYSASGCNNADALDTVSFTTPTAVLTVTDVRATTATLAIANRIVGWYYKRTAPSGDTTCHTVAADTPTASLASLTPGTVYTYTAYSASGCASADALDTVSFTAGVTVSNLGQSRSGLFTVGNNGYKTANQFGTGSNAGGYILSAVTIDIDSVSGSPGNLVVAIYPDSSGKPGSSARTTLSGSNPTGAGQYTFTCSTNCGLAAGTSYHVVLTAPGAGSANAYEWEKTNSASETRQPSDNGWTIDGADLDTGSGWVAETSFYGKFRVTALPNPALTASGLTLTSATLALANYGDAWWYKRTVPTGYDTCHRVAAGTTSVTLDGLTTKTSYTYKAYSKTGCNNADEIMTTTFTTPGSGDRHTGPDFDTLSAAGNTGPVALWSNGTTMWVTDWDDDKLYAYRLSDKSRDSAKDFDTLSAAGNTDPVGIWSDGTTMWVADLADDKLYAYRLSDKSRDSAKDFDTLNAAGNTDLRGIWSDGTTMWVADSWDDKLYAYKTSDKSRDAARDFDTLIAAGNKEPYDLWSDGTTMWVVDSADDKVYAYRTSDKSRDADKDYNTLSAAGNNYPTGIWSDGTTTWIADRDDDKLYAYHAFPPTNRLLASNLTDSGARLDLTWHTDAWWYTRTSPSGDTTCHSVAKGTTHVILSSLTAGTSYSYTAYSASNCGGASSELASVTFTAPTAVLTVTDVRATTATLAIANRSLGWYYKRIAPSGDTTCHTVAADTPTASLASLTPGTVYTYTAYSASGCANANELDTTSFTAGVTVSNLGQSRSGLFTVGNNGYKAANQFGTGSNAGGYILSAVTIDIDSVAGSPGNLVVAIYPDSSGKPGSSARTTLSGSNPTGAGQYTFTCSTNCGLSAGTSYHVVLTAPGAGSANAYEWEKTSSASETRQPSDNGWTIDGTDLDTGSGWVAETSFYGKFRVTAVPNPSLTASGLTTNSATLSLANYGGAWWYKRTAPSGDDTCHSIAAGTTSVALSTLTPNTSYTYKVYAASGCKAADEVTSVTFKTYALTAASVTPTGATLTLTGYSGGWWYKRTAPSGDNTCHSVAEGTTTAALTLTAGTSYTYKVYSKSTCNNADEIATLTFSTPVSFTASSITASGATLTIAGVSGDWWYKRIAPGGDATCHRVTGGGKTATLSSLTAGAAYLYKAYGKTGCASADELRSVTFTTPMSFSTLGNAYHGVVRVGSNQNTISKAAAQFTTGSRPNGYELSSVTVRISQVQGSPGNLTVAIYSNNSSSNEPNALLITLSNSPTVSGNRTFTCPSSSDCTLAANTKYHLLLEAPNATSGDNYYTWENSLSGATARQPAGNGWSLGESHEHSNSRWNDLTPHFRYRVRAVPKRALFATSVRPTTATLNLAPYTAAWWYKRTAPTGDDTCHSVAAGTTSDDLTGLTQVTAYTYKAYSKTGCNAADELESVTFTTPLPPTLTAMRLERTTADLVLAHWSNPWYYKANKAPDNTCKGPVAAGTSTKNVTGLTAATAYVYTAYSDNGCTASLANTGTFTTRNPAHDQRVTTKEIDLPYVNRGPNGMWSNGTTLWVTQHYSTQVYAYTLATGARDTSKEFTLHASNDAPKGMWSNGTTLWVTENYSTQVYAYTLATGVRDTDKEFTLTAGNAEPEGIWSDGTTLWVLDWRDSELYAYTLSSGARVTAKEFNLHADNDRRSDLWSDGTTMWVSDWKDEKVYAYLLAGGARATAREFALHADNGSPRGIWSDGTTLWVADSSVRKVFAYTAYAPPALTATSIAATSATLSLAHYGGAWWYERTTPSGDTTCHSVANGTTTASLASLTASTSYTYEAFSASGCANADKLDTVSFTTLAAGMSGSSVGNAGVTLAWQAGAAGRGAASQVVLPLPSPAGAADDPAPDSPEAAAYPDDFNTLAAAGNTSPDGLWSDGATLWVVDADDRMLYAYDLASKARDPGRDVILSANTLPLGLASDGVTLWVSDYRDDELHAYDVATRSYARARNLLLHPANAAPSALWTDGATLWAANDTDGKLYAYTLASGARARARDVTLHPDNASAGGLWSDGVTLWVSDPDADKVYAYTLSDGRRAAHLDYALDGANSEAYGLWSDGTTLWVVDDGADKVFAYEAR